MAVKDLRMLVDAILDYLHRVKKVEEDNGVGSKSRYSRVLIDFLIFTARNDIDWREMFVPDTVEAFAKHSGLNNASRAISALSNYLFSLGKISRPLVIQESRKSHYLPDIYNQYLLYCEQNLQVHGEHRSRVRGVLTSFHHYLQKNNVPLSELTIEHLDTFIAGFKVAETTRRTYRYHLKGFLKYLYHEQKMLKKDLASLLVGPAIFVQQWGRW